MAKQRKKRAKKQVKSGINIKRGTKLNPRTQQREEYVYVTIRQRGKKTVTKGYKYRGGSLNLYAREAKVPSGTKYHVDYEKNRIVRSPRLIQSLVKKTRLQRGRRGVKPKVTSQQITPRIKKTRSPPTPLTSKRFVDLIPNKTFYEREHSIYDFSNKERENKMLRQIVGNSTNSAQATTRLLKQFDKIKLKFSYSIVVKGINDTGQEFDMVSFTSVGKKPSEIVEMLKENDLVPGEQRLNLSSSRFAVVRQNLVNKGISKESIHFNEGKYTVSDVKMVVKYYNNPQKRLK